MGTSHIFSSVTMLTVLYAAPLTSYIPNKLQESVSKQIFSEEHEEGKREKRKIMTKRRRGRGQLMRSNDEL